ASSREGTESTGAIRWSKAVSMAVIGTSAGVSGAAALWVFVRPLGRPGRRVAAERFRFFAAAFALLAAFSASLRPTCSRRIGNDRRFWPLTRESVKQASPGTALPYKLAKNRARQWGCWPAVVTLSSSPAT